MRANDGGVANSMKDQNSEQFITIRPRQISLRQTSLHFSWATTDPQTGQMIASDFFEATTLAFSVSGSGDASGFNDGTASSASLRIPRRR